MLAKLRQKDRTAKQFAFFNALDTEKAGKTGKLFTFHHCALVKRHCQQGLCAFLEEEVYKGKIAFRAVGAYIREKDERTYKQIQLDHFYESLLDQGVSEDTPRPCNWREACMGD